MVITDFYQKTVFLDTAPLIYFIEGHSEYQENLRSVLSPMIMAISHLLPHR